MRITKTNILIAVVSLMMLATGAQAIQSLKSKTMVVKADIDLLVKAMVKDIASQELKKDELDAKTKEALARLDKVLKGISAKKNLLILNSKAVLASSDELDITSEVASQLIEGGQNE